MSKRLRTRFGSPSLKLLAKLAAGDLKARGKPTGIDEEDAFLTGLNLLAEELAAQNQEREAIQTSLRETNEELAMINDLHAEANRGASLSALLKALVQRTQKLFEAENIPALYLTDQSHPGELKLQISALTSATISTAETIMGRKLREIWVSVEKFFEQSGDGFYATPKIIEGRRASVNFIKSFAQGRIEHQIAGVVLKAFKFKTMMVVPLLDAPDVITGAIIISRVKPFSEQDIARGMRLAAPLASVISRRKAESSLARHESMLANAEMLVRFGSWELDLATQSVTWSPMQHEIMGLPSAQQPTQETLRQILHPDDVAKVDDIKKNIIEARKPVTYEFRISHPAKGERVFLSVADVIRDPKGKAIKIVGTDQDITDLRKATTNLRREEQRIDQVVSNLPLMIYSCDTDGRITHCSGMGLKSAGIDPEEQLGRRIQDLPGAGTTMTKAVNEALRGNTVSRKIKFSGAIFETVFSPLYNESGDIAGVNFIGLDITGKEEMETELTKAEKLHSIGEMAGGLAHDFNNYLTTIGMNISTALLTNNSPEEMQELLKAAAESVKRATSITQQLMVFTRGGEPVKKLVKIDEFLRNTADFALHGTNSMLEYDLPDALWNARIDRGQIEQVVDNLVLNATQAMPSGGIITISAENVIVGEDLRMGPLEFGEYVRVTVRDTGNGIDEENLSRIFEPYFTTKQEGSGLGLFSSYRILERHGGWINAASNGEGSTFRFYLPASPAENVESEKIGNVISGSGNILIMDDEEPIRTVLSLALERLGYSVCATADGEEAIKEYRSRQELGDPFDVVILDLTIPGGLGGKATIERLLSRDPKIKAIVASGYADDPVMARHREHGFTGVMAKPFDVKTLSHVIAEVMKS